MRAREILTACRVLWIPVASVLGLTGCGSERQESFDLPTTVGQISERLFSESQSVEIQLENSSGAFAPWAWLHLEIGESEFRFQSDEDGKLQVGFHDLPAQTVLSSSRAARLAVFIR